MADPKTQPAVKASTPAPAPPPKPAEAAPSNTKSLYGFDFTVKHN